MQLYYYRDKIGNFGDDLNQFIWYTLYPDIFDENPNSIALGIGTLINHHIPRAPKKYVLGSGVGYGSIPAINQDWKFVCVRGPISAEILKLPTSLSITDPAIFVADIVKRQSNRQAGNTSFMPHHRSAAFGDWKSICNELNLTYLDPAANIHETIHHINQSKLVIAEAMHAAIVADALRVPWIPVTCYNHISELKWKDWCLSLDMEYKPQQITSLWGHPNSSKTISLLKSTTKHILSSTGLNKRYTHHPVNYHTVKSCIIDQLGEVLNKSDHQLSPDNTHINKLSQLHDCIDKFSKSLIPT